MKGEEAMAARMDGNGQGFPEIGKAVGAATALLAAMGVGSGVALRLLRNFPIALGVSVLALVGGTLLAMLAGRKELRTLGFLLFLISLGVVTWFFGEASQAKERPQIVTSSETTPGGLIKVTAKIRADGLTMHQTIYVGYRGSERVAVHP